MSHAKGLPLAHGRSVIPSGRLPSCRIRLTGSLTAGICALFIDRHIIIIIVYYADAAQQRKNKT